MADDKRFWGIHTLDDSLFLNESIIAIGWKEVGDLSLIGSTREDFKAKCLAVYSDAKKGAIPNYAGMLYRFLREAKVGDYVVYPSKPSREIYLGVIDGEYEYVPTAREYPQQRRVKWLKHLPRTVFTQGALYEVGSAMSFFSVNKYKSEFSAALEDGFTSDSVRTDGDTTVAATAEAIKESTRDYIIKELSAKQKGYPLENFVASLLSAMGYRTLVSPHGGDGGIDIIAYRDELPPRVCVQVKSRDGNVPPHELQALKGAMMPGDYGFFVTLADYTPKAREFLTANPMIRGINGAELAGLVMRYYGSLDDNSKRIIPLEFVPIPVTDEN